MNLGQQSLVDAAKTDDKARLVRYSVVVLTYNRPGCLLELVEHLVKSLDGSAEIIVVDNASETSATQILETVGNHLKIIRLASNEGAVGRNHGMQLARGEIIICLDDDILGIDQRDLGVLAARFREPDVAAVCFKVINARSRQVMNWCHPRPVESSADCAFETSEISEGAVAFSSEALREVGLYPKDFFISHEGADLAFRLINHGYRIEYEPSIVVLHAVAAAGRASWRRYYFDARNAIWLAARNYPFVFGMRRVIRKVGALLLYSIRDGYVAWWAKGIFDGLRGVTKFVRQRQVVRFGTIERILEIESNKPGVWYMARKRLLRRGVEI